MTRPASAIATLVAVALLAPGATGRATAAPIDPAGPIFPNVSINGVIGLGTPVGFAGAELGLEPWAWLSLSAGVGSANSTAPNPSSAAMVRLRLLRETRGAPSRLTLGYGLSRGKYTVEVSSFLSDTSHPGTWQGEIWWHNFEAGIEWHEPDQGARRQPLALPRLRHRPAAAVARSGAAPSDSNRGADHSLCPKPSRLPNRDGLMLRRALMRASDASV